MTSTEFDQTRGDDELDVPIFTIGCSNKTDPTKCLLYLSYGKAGDPDGGDEFLWMMTCYHCSYCKKTAHPAFTHRRRFGIKTGQDSRKLKEFIDIEPIAIEL